MFLVCVYYVYLYMGQVPELKLMMMMITEKRAQGMVEPVKIDITTEIRNLISGCRFACRVPSMSIMLILSSPENHMLTATTTPGTDQPAQAEVSLTPTDLVSAAGSGTNECLQPVHIESHQNDSPDTAPLPCNEFYDVISLPQRQSRATRKE